MCCLIKVDWLAPTDWIPTRSIEVVVMNVVAPNLEIREGFQAMVALTSDGKLVTGFIERESPDQLVMRSIDGQITRSIAPTLSHSSAALVADAEGLLDNLTSEQLCDLFGI